MAGQEDAAMTMQPHRPTGGDYAPHGHKPVHPNAVQFGTEPYGSRHRMRDDTNAGGLYGAKSDCAGGCGGYAFGRSIYCQECRHLSDELGDSILVTRDRQEDW